MRSSSWGDPCTKGLHPSPLLQTGKPLVHYFNQMQPPSAMPGSRTMQRDGCWDIPAQSVLLLFLAWSRSHKSSNKQTKCLPESSSIQTGALSNLKYKTNRSSYWSRKPTACVSEECMAANITTPSKRSLNAVSWWGGFLHSSNKLTCTTRKRFSWCTEKSHTTVKSYQSFYTGNHSSEICFSLWWCWEAQEEGWPDNIRTGTDNQKNVTSTLGLVLLSIITYVFFFKGGKVNIEVHWQWNITRAFQDNSTFQWLAERPQGPVGLSERTADVTWFCETQNASDEQRCP